MRCDELIATKDALRVATLQDLTPARARVRGVRQSAHQGGKSTRVAYAKTVRILMRTLPRYGDSSNVKVMVNMVRASIYA